MPPSRGSQGGNKLKNLDFYDLLLKFREKGLADICDLIDDVKDARIGRLEAETSVQDARISQLEEQKSLSLLEINPGVSGNYEVLLYFYRLFLSTMIARFVLTSSGRIFRSSAVSWVITSVDPAGPISR